MHTICAWLARVFREPFLGLLKSRKVLGLSLLAAIAPAQAGDRLLATGGVTQLEGAAGGGLTPWALIAGYGTRDQIGASAFLTHVDTGDSS